MILSPGQNNTPCGGSLRIGTISLHGTQGREGTAWFASIRCSCHTRRTLQQRPPVSCWKMLFASAKYLLSPPRWTQIHTSPHKVNCWSFFLHWKWYSIYVSGTLLFWLLAVETDDSNHRAAFGAAWHGAPQRITPRLRQDKADTGLENKSLPNDQ